MGAKDIQVKPISGQDARRLCKLYHYSGKVVVNSQLHLGVFYNGHCEGVMSYGPSTDKRRMAKNLGVKINEFLELNRMAFSDNLPKYSESRAISVAHKIIKKNYPFIKVILSFSDGTQCGDGTIYRASGFRLIDIKKNLSLLSMCPSARAYLLKFIPNLGNVVTHKSLNNFKHGGRYLSSTVREYGTVTPLQGFQLKYIYCLDSSYWSRFTTIPFDKIKEVGASMYKGKRVEHESNAQADQA